MLTDMRFWIGIGVGAAFVAFLLPWFRGTMASRAQGG